MMALLVAAATLSLASAVPTGKPVQVYILMGQSNMLGEGRKDGTKAGSLTVSLSSPLPSA